MLRAEHRYLRYGAAPRRLIVATATRFCDTGNDSDYGNHLNRLAVANKLDFVHLHGAELWVHDEPVRLQGDGVCNARFYFPPLRLLFCA